VKTQQAPNVPGKTDAERFSNAAVSKEKERMKTTATRRKEARAGTVALVYADFKYFKDAR